MMFERFTDEARTVGEPASEVLCAYGLTPEFVEEEIVRRVGLGAGGGLFGGLDSEALATIGIDLDAVRARIEASLGEQALARAAQTASQEHRAQCPAARGRRPGYRAPGPRPSGHIPYTPVAKKILEITLREAIALTMVKHGRAS
ncbi:MAG: hypothetical protein ABSB59_17375 [Streptosporangiaceae bacterium]|jgi:hypothetical protein